MASDSLEARAATIGAPPEAYLEWADLLLVAVVLIQFACGEGAFARAGVPLVPKPPMPREN